MFEDLQKVIRMRKRITGNLRKVGKNYMIVGHDEKHSNVYTLNATAAYLWQEIGNEEFSTDKLVNLLCRKYDVDAITAETDIRSLILEWGKLGLIDVN